MYYIMLMLILNHKCMLIVKCIRSIRLDVVVAVLPVGVAH